MPATRSGYEALGILAHFDLAAAGPGSAASLHLLAEAMGHAFADGATYADDPELAAEPIAELGQAPFAAIRAAAIRADYAAPRPIIATAPWLAPGHAGRGRSRPAACTAPPRSSRRIETATWLR